MRQFRRPFRRLSAPAATPPLDVPGRLERGEPASDRGLVEIQIGRQVSQPRAGRAVLVRHVGEHASHPQGVRRQRLVAHDLSDPVEPFEG